MDGAENAHISDTARRVVMRVTTSGTAYLTEDMIANV